MTYALLLAFFRNDMGFGGNNGLTDFKDMLGFDLQARGTRLGLYFASVIGAGAGAISLCRFIVALEARPACCWRCATPRRGCASSAIR